MNDDGKKITMVIRNLIGITSKWSANGSASSSDMTGVVPNAVFTALNEATSDWTSVNL